MKATRRGLLLAAAAAAAAVAAGGALASGSLEVTRLDWRLGRRVAVLVDLHLHGPPRRDLVEALHALKPSLVVLAGDVVDELTPGFDALPGWLSRLLPGGSEGLAVPGNHEHYLARSGRLSLARLGRLLSEAGFTLLSDGVLEAGGLRVAGVDWRDDPRGYAEAVARLEALEPTLVVAHSPDVFPHASRGRWVAGHTHGGQVCLPGARSVVTNSLYGFRWGLYRRGAATLYVSRGLGEMLPPRLYCPHQLLVID
ncbi:MAG: metallophosphoesterase [Crenarchaeota archaeon]|nr:metallophosphoesterase [Thermoproteota archaeon]